MVDKSDEEMFEEVILILGEIINNFFVLIDVVKLLILIINF